MGEHNSHYISYIELEKYQTVTELHACFIKFNMSHIAMARNTIT